MVAHYPFKQGFHLCIDCVIAGDGNAQAAALGNHLGCLLDGLRAILCRRAAANAAPGDIDGGALFPQDQRDTSPCTTAGAGNYCDLAF